MINFNGKIIITSCDTLDAEGAYSIVANFSDNTASFNAKDSIIGDIIYAKASNIDGDIDYHLYQITEIDSSRTKSNRLVATIKFAEDYTNTDEICTPDLENDAMVCRLSSEQGFAMLANSIQGFAQNEVDNLRNINLAQFDAKHTAYIKQYIDDKIAGLPKNDSADTNQIYLKTDQHYVLLDDTGKQETFTGELSNFSETITATTAVNEIKAVTSDVSINKSTTYNSQVTNITDNISGSSITLENNIGTDGTTTIISDTNNINGSSINRSINITGDDVTQELIINGNNSAKVNITINSTNSDSPSELNIITEKTTFSSTNINMASAKVQTLGVTISGTPEDDTDAITIGYLKQYLIDNPQSDTTLADKVNTNTNNISDITNKVDTFIDSTYVTDKSAIEEEIDNLRTLIGTTGDVLEGTYTTVTVNSNGKVINGSTHDAIDIIGTSNTEFGLGTYSIENNYANLYAWANDTSAPGTPIPFIRYNFIDKCWEFSNDGTTVKQLGSTTKQNETITNLDLGSIDEIVTTTIDLNEKSSVDSDGVVTQLADNIDLNDSEEF